MAKRYVPVSAVATATSGTDALLYMVPSGAIAKLTFVSCSEAGSSNIAHFYLGVKSSGSSSILKGFRISALGYATGQTISYPGAANCVDAGIYFNEGDMIYAKTSNTTGDIFISLIEEYDE